ncbi:hypothetical protein [Haloferula sp. BvORR071]|uniref:hypothetical protein n=1 Tax=Haloferula sp. BvORR071 TaxID=1396141 RepID=UPI00054D029D|nr:hypothetical protein [Haloferula sp. BvORR071]
MAEERQDPPKPRGSCLGKLASLFTFAGVLGLGVAVFYITQPQDLSDLKGTSPAAGTARTRDLHQVLKNAVHQSFPLNLTEEEINLYLKQSLQAKQGGALEKFVTLDDVRVRLEKGMAEVIIVRSVMGRPLTTSMYFRVEQNVALNDQASTDIIRDGGTLFPMIPDTQIAHRVAKGGRFGQLVVPAGFVKVLALPAFEKLADAYKPELDIAFTQMARISIEDGKLVLDPRPNGSALPGAGEKF